MSAIAFAQATGIPYFHTPLHSVEHGDDREAFAARWETAFNLGTGFERTPDDAPLISGKTLLEGYAGPPAILRQEYFHRFVDRNPNLYSRLAATWRSQLALPAVEASGKTIAVHVRRGDVGPHDPARYTSNEMLGRFIKQVRKRRPGARIVILSEGVPADFSGLAADAEYQLNRDIFETVAMMIQSDDLIMAKSSLSYVCGVLSFGTVHYEKFWHKPLPS